MKQIAYILTILFTLAFFHINKYFVGFENTVLFGMAWIIVSIIFKEEQ